PQRDQTGPRDTADRMLERLADVEDHRGDPGVDPRLQRRRGQTRVSRLRSFGASAGQGPLAVLAVFTKLGDRRVRAAGGAVGILRQPQLAEPHAERVVDEKPPDEWLADPEDHLDGFGRLDRADDAGQHAEHAGFGATRQQPGRRRLRMEAAVARPPGAENTEAWPSK